MSALSTFDALANNQHQETETLFLGQWQAWTVNHALWFAQSVGYATQRPAGEDSAMAVIGRVLDQELAAHFQEADDEYGLWLTETCAVWAKTELSYFDEDRTYLRIQVSAVSADDRDRLLAQLTEALPEVVEPEEEPDDKVIELRFWTTSMGGPRYNMRDIQVPAWEQIAHNYAVGEELSPLMDPAFRPAGEGKLILWYGPAGTGKTHAVRSLMHAWQEWCAPHYIMDPERLFGDAEYLTGLVSHLDSDMWNLLVVEDAGELLREDAADRSGQGLSRLLNLTDGLIGQGLRILVLITTNEPFDELHQAVQRPGRCLSRLEFGQLDAEQATAWLQRHWPQATAADAPASLAELFARLPAEAQPGRLENI